MVIRVKLHNQCRDISSRLRIKPDLWNSKFNSVKGTLEAAKQINKLLDISRNRLFEIFTQLTDGDRVMTDDVVDMFHGKTIAKEYYLLKLITEHNKHIRSRIGKDHTKSTFQKYWAMEIRVNQYVTKQYVVPYWQSIGVRIRHKQLCYQPV
ncbi:MAG: hypothetical protein LH478_02605 [Chitinophagaceae bacterium]|nr:hypothetical protein [Chitinophagaceae bacterium]